MAKGNKSKLASVNLPAAITSEGISFCAKRIKMEAVETARIPTNNPARYFSEEVDGEDAGIITVSFRTIMG
jgi:hypothetical protein